MHEKNYDLTDIAESWLRPSHNWAMYFSGYVLFWRERVEQKGGSVCLYARSDPKVNVEEDLVDGVCWC